VASFLWFFFVSLLSWVYGTILFFSDKVQVKSSGVWGHATYRERERDATMDGWIGSLWHFSFLLFSFSLLRTGATDLVVVAVVVAVVVVASGSNVGLFQASDDIQHASSTIRWVRYDDEMRWDG
jgi:hypothetical protein